MWLISLVSLVGMSEGEWYFLVPQVLNGVRLLSAMGCVVKK